MYTNLLLYIIVYYCILLYIYFVYYFTLFYTSVFGFILISSENARVITLAMNELERNSLYYSKCLVSLQTLSKTRVLAI